MNLYKYEITFEEPVHSCEDCPLGYCMVDAPENIPDLEGSDLVCLARIDPSDIACSTEKRPENCPMTFMGGNANA